MSYPGLLGLVWISAKSKTLQCFMKNIRHSFPDQLRLKGMKNVISLTDLAYEETRHCAIREDGIPNTEGVFHLYAPDWKDFVAQGMCILTRFRN